MQFAKSLVLGLSVVLLLVGCFAGGGGPNGGGTDYDGIWEVAYVDPGFTDPAAGTGQTMFCSQPTVSMTVVNGSGSTKVTTICQAYTTGTSTKVGPELDYYYLVSVFIVGTATSGDVITAAVNGASLTGKCIPQGCAAQGLAMKR
jgi:hypothetical protein